MTAAAHNVREFLQEHNRKDLLRLLTCGSVDDGKSTLIGRLLHDSKLVYEDTLAALQRDSERHGTAGSGNIDYALLVDGLKAEREQGITIDVAYRYFSTPGRKFIIADTPGHEQYTRNMATGASTSDLAILLVDARNGVITQTRRHSFIVSLLGIQHVVVAINKMDLVNYDQKVFETIREDYTDFVARLGINDLHFIPISALRGDNLIEPSDRMPWYQGTPLLTHLENVHIAGDRNLVDFRMPVQYVNRPHLDFRGFCGTVASGVVRKTDQVMALPSRRHSRVKNILSGNGSLEEAFTGQAVTLVLEDEIDISRGDTLVHLHNVPHHSHRFEAMLVWMNEQPLQVGRQYLVKHTANLVTGVVSQLRYQVDVNSLRRNQSESLQLNEIGRVQLNLSRALSFDPYDKNRSTGSFILIDRLTNATVAAGMIIDRVSAQDEVDTERTNAALKSRTSLVSVEQRKQRLGQSGFTLWISGLPKSGKAALAYLLEKRLFDLGYAAKVLDGSDLRKDLNRNLGFSGDDRSENVRRAAAVARILNDAGIIALVSLGAPFEEHREAARNSIGAERFFQVYLSAPLDYCEARDDDHLYARARAGEISDLPGLSSPFEEPRSADLVLPNHEMEMAEILERVLDTLTQKELIS